MADHWICGAGSFWCPFYYPVDCFRKKGESTIPLAFWYCSIGGAMVLLSYAIYRQDPVFIIGQSLGSIVYVRNLVLIDRKRKATVGADSEQLEN